MPGPFGKMISSIRISYQCGPVIVLTFLDGMSDRPGMHGGLAINSAWIGAHRRQEYPHGLLLDAIKELPEGGPERFTPCRVKTPILNRLLSLTSCADIRVSGSGLRECHRPLP